MRKLLPLLFVACSGAAWAQSAEVWFNAGKSLLSNSGLGTSSPTGNQNDFHLDDGFRFGFRFGFNMGDHLGHEIQYAYSRTHLISGGVDTGGMAIHEGGYNLLGYLTKEGSRIRPFGTAGVEFANFVPPGSSGTSGGGSTKFGINYGGGVKVKVRDNWALRFDVRRYDIPKPDFGLLFESGWLHQTEVSAGIGYVF
jgi:opacity protein-like surface antigen